MSFDSVLFADSPAMRDVSTAIARAAAVRAAGVMLRGEDGTGRRLIARAIHAMQAAGRPFVTVDCAVFDSDGLEERLFGADAPSSQRDSARGLERVAAASLVHQANGGTIYLQNVAEASARIQARLARILRDREVQLAETGETVPCDVRPMAGVDPSVDDSVREGRVRDDLFRRLSAIQIEVPALRNRRDDIPALANHFVREICTGIHMPPKTFSAAALSLISALPWRGNAAELRALVEAVVGALSGNRGITVEDVLMHLRLDEGSVAFTNGGTLRQARARFERDYISAVLDKHRGRISEAARALGIQRTNLYRKMRSLKVGRIKNDTNRAGS